MRSTKVTSFESRFLISRARLGMTNSFEFAGLLRARRREVDIEVQQIRGAAAVR
jgi:hypothetical protein